MKSKGYDMFSSWMMVTPEKLSTAIHLNGPDICLDLRTWANLSADILKCIQLLPVYKKFSVFVSAEDKGLISASQFSNGLISLFFQPSFYQFHGLPVVFTKDPYNQLKPELENLTDQLKAQGFEG